MKPIYIRTKSNSSFKRDSEKEWPIDKLEAKLKTMEIPKTLKLSDCEFISDTDKFIESHVAYARENNGNPVFKPYYDRLVKLYKKAAKSGLND